MTNILKILFICAFLAKQPLIHPDSVFIPVEISGGGTISIEPLNHNDTGVSEREIKVENGEIKQVRFSFEEEGSWAYSLYETNTLDPQAAKDPTVYILKIVCGEKGKVEQVLLYQNGSDEKSGRAIWNNTKDRPVPDTRDSAGARIYAMTSFISLIIAAVLFRCAKGDDDEV